MYIYVYVPSEKFSTLRVDNYWKHLAALKSLYLPYLGEERSDDWPCDLILSLQGHGDIDSTATETAKNGRSLSVKKISNNIEYKFHT